MSCFCQVFHFWDHRSQKAGIKRLLSITYSWNVLGICDNSPMEGFSMNIFFNKNTEKYNKSVFLSLLIICFANDNIFFAAQCNLLN